MADPLETQRDVGFAVMGELQSSGLSDAREIGRGGFGVVYRCTEPALDRVVAVKVLTTDLDHENRNRFVREQRAMGRLTGHPNIVSALRVGESESGHPFIVMQFHEQGSLDARIRRHGPLPLDELLRLGVRLAGALETAHRLGILHRDVKPANILFTGYGEPALTDFGIAHIAGGFETATGVITGSPAFTAPEVLDGQSPSPASDIDSLGATLFCAMTGHAAFERRSGEQMMAQFIRITTDPPPDLREQGIPGDVANVIETAMAGEPGNRPSSALAFGDQLRAAQHHHGFPVTDPVLSAASVRGQQRSPTSPLHQGHPPAVFLAANEGGNLPQELTSFVGRRRELDEVKGLFSEFHLVTLTGAGGVGKTRLAVRTGASFRRAFNDGVWLVQAGDVRDELGLADTISATLRVQDHSARAANAVLVDFLSSRSMLLIFDNCEQIVNAAANLAVTLLQSCPDLRILATSREALGVAGEAVLRVPPLRVPEIDRESPPLQALPGYDAVTLFAERANAAVPGFTLTEENKGTVTRICRRLDGLPLPIELAAARLRVLSPEQVLARLADRFALLNQGSRVAPTRQQTLRACVDWSYELCSASEQLVWARLSVFAGSFELDAAEEVCGEGLSSEELLDVLTTLVDKSILTREEHGTAVRFRLLGTLGDYGRERAQTAGDYQQLRRRHCDWYEHLTLLAESEWISSRQLYWIARLEWERSNLHETLEFCIQNCPETGVRIAVALVPFWNSRSMFSEALCVRVS